MYNYLVDFDFYQKGRPIFSDKQLEEAKHQTYFDGDISDIFAVQQTEVNGLQKIDNILTGTQFNYFRVASRFYQNALCSELPLIAEDIGPRRDEVYDLLQDIVQAWSIFGRATIVGSNNVYQTVNPVNHIVVSSPFNRRDIQGHILVHPYLNTYRDLSQNPDLNPTLIDDLFNPRCTITRIADGVTEISIWEIEDNNHLGERISSTTVTPQAIHCFDTDESFYPEMKSLLREFIVRINALQVSLNSSIKPYLFIPSGVINAPVFAGMSSDDLAKVQMDFTSEKANPLSSDRWGRGGVIEGSLAASVEPKFVERTGAGLSESFDYLTELAAMMSLSSGVPNSVFGVTRGSVGETHSSRERTIFAAQSRVNKVRRLLIKLFRESLGITLEFPHDAFASVNSKFDSALQAYNSGIITLNEAREALGQSPRDGGDTLKEPERQAASLTTEPDPGRNNNPEGDNNINNDGDGV